MVRNDEPYRKFAAGVVILRAQDANWNADFSNWPRKLPDGRFYSTDKALKYAIRKYLKEVKKEPVIFWRVYNEEGDIGNLAAMLDKNGIKITDKNIPEQVLEKGIDVRLFGGTFTLKKQNFSITGPVQITYGIDIWNKGKAYVSQIQSPKYEPKEGEGSDKPKYGSQSTLGSEVRLTEAHYAFDFTVNPNNLEKDDFIISVVKDERRKSLLNSDIELFKEALKYGPGYVTSATKTGVFSELVVFAEFKMEDEEGLVPLVPILKNGVGISEINNESLKRRLDIRNVVKILKNLGATKIEVAFNPDLCEVNGGEGVTITKI